MEKRMHRMSNIDTETMTGTCKECGVVPIYKHHSGSWCCRIAKRQANKAYYKKYPWKHIPGKPSKEALARASKNHSRRNYEIRLECIEHYGGKCVVCGDNNPKHLVFDHINNDGNIQRKTVPAARFPRFLKREGYPDYIQLLCWNHNMERCFYNTMTPSFI